MGAIKNPMWKKKKKESHVYALVMYYMLQMPGYIS